MAMTTLAEVKAILQITVTTYDTLITTLLPIAQAKYLEVRGINFFEFNANIAVSSPSIQITDENDLTLMNIKDKVETSYDDGIKMRGRVLRKVVVAGITYVVLDANATATVIDQPFIIYPGSADYVIAKMIDYFMNKDNGNGYKSETFGSYNYTKFDVKSGLPTDITDFINSYQSGK